MIFIEKVIFLVPVVSCEHRHQLYPAHRRGRGAKGGLGLKNHLHFGNGWLCRGPGQRLEVPKAGSRKWWRGFPYSLLYHVAHWGKESFLTGNVLPFSCSYSFRWLRFLDFKIFLPKESGWWKFAVLEALKFSCQITTMQCSVFSSATLPL